MALDTFNPYLFVSAGEQSNKFLTPTYSGGIASFQAQRAQDLSGLTIRINPIQEGTGDPSPTNIRPISGRTGMTVTRAGKNLLALPASAITTNGVTVEATSDGELWVHGTPTIERGYISFSLPQLPKVVVDKMVSISINEKMVGIGVVFGAGDGTLNLTLTGTDTHKTGVYKSGSRNPQVNVRYDVGAINKKFQIQLEISSAPSAFVPYVAPNTYPISWQTEAGTIYGGTLDVVSGRLTVDFVGIILDGTTHSFTDMNTYWHIIPTDYGEIKTYGHTTQPEYVLSSFTMGVSKWGTTGNNDGLFTRASNWTNIFNSVDDINNFITVTPQQLVVPLATPQTYQLSPTEVRTIAGFNQIYSDAGPVIDIKF